MLKNILVIFSLVAAAYGSGQMTILECPETILFKKIDKMDGKYIGPVLSACTAHSIAESVPLKLQITSPFDLAENVCLINIQGLTDFTPQNIKPKSEIEIIGSENSIEVFTNKLYDEGSPIVHVNLDDGLEALSGLQDWCETPLKAENSKVLKTLKDEKNIESKQILEAVTVMSILSEAKCNMPTYLQFDLNLNGVKSRDHVNLLVSTIEEFAQNFQSIVNGKGIVAVITADGQPLKRTRRATEDTQEDYNLAGSYSEDYPVIFNIILWFGVLMVFSTLAITYAIGSMDPGRDSIIYRMTSTRIKKDN